MPSGDLIIERNAALNELAGKEHFTPIKNINDANANLVKEVITALIDVISIRHKDELAQLIESNILPIVNDKIEHIITECNAHINDIQRADPSKQNDCIMFL